MEELIVDFNRVDKAGRVPAFIPAGHEAEFYPGLRVEVTDGEGTQCAATVAEIGHTGRYVLLVPEPGSFRYDEPEGSGSAAAGADSLKR